MVKKICILSLCLVLFGCNKESPNIFNLDSEQVVIEKQWILVTYWAAWCAHCRRELPELYKLQQELGDKITVIALNYDNLSHENKKLTQEVEQLQIGVNVLSKFDAGKLSKYFALSKPRAIPTSVIIDNKGKVRKTLVGQQGEVRFKQELENLGF